MSPVAEPLSPERLAEIRERVIYSAERSLDATINMLVGADVPDLLAEVDRLRTKLDAPCGSCHPCTNYADETWRAAGRTPPHVYRWDELNAEVEQLRERIAELERGRDLAIKFRNEGATDGEITEGFLGLWGGAQ